MHRVTRQLVAGLFQEAAASSERDAVLLRHVCVLEWRETSFHLPSMMMPQLSTPHRFIRIAALMAFTMPLSPLGSRLAVADEKNESATTVDFRRDVRPILSEKCFKCHGPDEKTRQADLRLDDRNAAEHVLSFDHGEQSELLRRITSKDLEEIMPPPNSKSSLSPQEIETLSKWVRQGARYAKHWAFEPIRSVNPPAVRDEAWVRNPVDRFILSRLERDGLTASAEAEKEKLIRRASFDLTGLPPSLEEIDAFLEDESESAYETLVDRLLSTDAYGERMTSDWLDVARYSDTYGYQVDRDRYVWPWRDWVIRAFNRNMPFDQFLTWQLAGDLLPHATDEQILATTFNRLHPQKVEGGSVPEEFRVEYVADRNHTLATAFLGLTLECARCHDHKYDPITQQEYYQLFAFFNNIDEAGLYSWYTPAVPTPTLLLPDEPTKSRMSVLTTRVADAEANSAVVAETRSDAFRSWLDKRPSEPALPGRIAHLDFEDAPAGANELVPGRVGSAVRLSGDDGIAVGARNFPRHEPFSISLWMKTPDVKERAIVFHCSRAWTDAGSRGYQLLIEEGKLSFSLIHFWPGNAIRIKTRDPIPTEKWLHVAVTNDGSSRADGLRIFVNGRAADCEIVRDHLTKNISYENDEKKSLLTIGQRSRDRGFTGGLVDEFQVFERQLTALEVVYLHDGQTLADLLALPTEQLTPQQAESLRAYYLHTADAVYQEHLAALQKAREELSGTVDPILEIMVMRERSPTRPTFLLKRGAYDAPAEQVAAGTPAVFPPFPESEPRNRLGLARWLTGPSHPLTARVAVNRLWQMCFGYGLVRTPEDFGSQGEAPSHPQLLDWLAKDLVDNGWNVKRLLKTIVTSATYRQSTVSSVELLKHDPENRLLARGSRYRLPAEMIRDNALSVSGLLVKTIGGPPARPYELAVSFKPQKPDTGEGLYRRSLYTFWKRTGPAPVMMSLDASKRDVCSVKRERTSSPLQSLVLMNGPQFVEAARMLAQRLLQKHGEELDSLIEDMFRVLTSRRPTVQERNVLSSLYHEQQQHFEEHVSQAEQFLQSGQAPRDENLPLPQLAAAALLANTLMNYDGCVVKR